MNAERHRFAGRGVRWLVPALPVWLVGLHVLVPWLIAAAYEERAPSWLNAVLAGRAVHPLERYLGAWRGLAWKLDLLALAGLMLFLVRRPLSRLLAPVLRAEPRIGAGRVLATALLVGMAGGVLQGVHIGVRKAVTPLNAAVLNDSIEAFWMTPIGEAAYVLIAGFVVVLLARAWRTPVSLRLVVTVFAFLAVYGLLRSARLGISPWPLRLLAAGVAFQAGAWLAARPAGLRRRTPALLVGLAGWTLASALVLHGGRALREWRSVLALRDPAPDSPNVLLLILDTVRAQSLGLYGHEHPTTPRLQMLAADAVVFERATAVTSWTLPSHGSMLTGRLPWEIAADWNTPLSHAHPTLAEALAGRGYATAGFVANNTYAGRDAGIARGFQHFRDVRLSLNSLILNSWMTNHAVMRIRARFGMKPQVTMDAREVSEKFLGWVARQDRPFFAMLNYMDAHSPYTAPDSIRARFAEVGALNESHRDITYAPDELRQLRHSYDAAIAYIDEEIGRIVDTLRARGQLEKTILIVTADHGEQFGGRDPRLVEHGNDLYDVTLHVPLLIRYPPLVPAGRRIAGAVGTRRIAATVMDLVSGSPSPFPGGSLKDAFAPDAGTTTAIALASLLPSGHVFSHEPVSAGPMASAHWLYWHYIRNGDGAEELYDIESDPWERENLAGDPALGAVLERLRASVPEPNRLAGGNTAPVTSGASH